MRKSILYLSSICLLGALSACSIIDAKQGSSEADDPTGDSSSSTDAGWKDRDSDSNHSNNNSGPWNFQALRSWGFTSVPGACSGVKNGEMKARFVLLDDAQSPIIGADDALDPPADRGENGFVQMRPDALSLAFTNSALMQVTASPCVDDFSCDNSPFAYECAVAPNLGSAPGGQRLNACQVPEDALQVVPGQVEFVSDIANDQVFGMLMENTGGLRGWSLPGTEGAWDANGDGQINGLDDLPPFSALYGADIASDPQNIRLQAVINAYSNWVSTYQVARQTARNTYFGLWSFNDHAVKAKSHIELAGEDGAIWASTSNRISGAITYYQNEYAALNTRSRANVYEAALALINDAYSTQAMADLGMASPETADKVLVIFVDGYDDMRKNVRADIEQVIHAARQHKVRIFIAHADPAFKKPRQIREDPEYWKGQTPCENDSQCKNYESCRKPKGYGSGDGTEVLKPEGFDHPYCLPVRDENGRVGPIADYARLACETEGGYLYSPTIDTVPRNLKWTPLALDGLWEVGVHSARLDPKPSPWSVALKLHTEMHATVAGQSRDFAFTQLGALGEVGPGASVETFDARAVIFTAD